MTRNASGFFISALILLFLSSCDLSGFSSEPAKRLIRKRCSSCHAAKRIYSTRRSSKEWEQIMARMIRHGAVPTQEEKMQILDYLGKEYSTSGPFDRAR